MGIFSSKVSKAAAASGLGHLGAGVSSEEAEALFKTYDKDSNGVLDWNECKLLVADLVKETAKAHKDSGDELKAALEDPDLVNKVLVAFDGNGDGSVSKDEFVAKAMEGYALPLAPKDEPSSKRRKVEQAAAEAPATADGEAAKADNTAAEHKETYEERHAREERECEERDKVYHDHMKNVDEEHKLMVEFFEKAHQAHEAGEFNKIKGFKEQANEHKRLKEEAKEAAMQFMYDRANAESDGSWIDLHGLQVDFALKKTGQFIDKSAEEGKKECDIITGAGHHSGPGGPHIKPKVHSMLKSRSLSFSEINEGEVKVDLA